MMTLISGCTTDGHVQAIKVIDYNCYMPHAIMIDSKDVLTSRTARDILFLNEEWSAVCNKTNQQQGRNDAEH